MKADDVIISKHDAKVILGELYFTLEKLQNDACDLSGEAWYAETGHARTLSRIAESIEEQLEKHE